MNKAILTGRLTRDPEVRYSQQNNTAVARYTIAVDRITKNTDQSADFIRCVCFGKTAEFAEKYFYKGIKIAITGRIQTESRNASSAAPSTQPSSNPADQFMDIPDGIDEELPFN